jgi:hypothetical protein
MMADKLSARVLGGNGRFDDVSLSTPTPECDLVGSARLS